MRLRPSLLMLTAGAASLSVLANAVSAADAPSAAPETRLGASIRQDMASRDQATARRNRALELREQAARATEERLKNSVQAGNNPASGPPSGQASAPPPETEDRFSELARIYQAMRPNRAAAVFEQLEMDVQVQVAQRMRERSTALILANMSPKGAAALTMAMARRSPLPMRPQPRGR